MSEDPEEPGNWLSNSLDTLRRFNEGVGDVRAFVNNLKGFRQQLQEQNLLAFSKTLMALLSGKPHTSLRHVPAHMTLSVLEEASYEDDPKIHELWAGLLATAMDPASANKPRRVFISILRSMDPTDVTILRFLVSRYQQGAIVEIGDLYNTFPQTTDPIPSENSLRLSFDNLARLGCLQYDDERGKSNYVTVGTDPGARPLIIKLTDAESFRVTPLAISLLRACGVRLNASWN
jgi:hypothetical protein